MPGVNLSDRQEGWQNNFRVPDVAVFLSAGKAKNCGTHWCGPADLIIEIVSPDDQSREKIPFYSALGTRELVLVERDPWALEMYSHDGTSLLMQSRSTPEDNLNLKSQVLPLSFHLCPGESRPQIEVIHREADRRWIV